MVKVIAKNKIEASKRFKQWNQKHSTKVSLKSIKVVPSDMPSPGHKMFNATLLKKK